VLCPQCRSGYCRRSRRRNWQDYAISAFSGLRPWRCRSCGLRFLAWSVALSYLGSAHCRRCGNMDLQRVSATHVIGWFALLGRIAHVPAYRCGPCRSCFFSFLKNRRLRPIEDEILDPVETQQPAAVGPR
jgi:hypothetical protein